MRNLEDHAAPLAGQRVVLLGPLVGMPRRDVERLIAAQGGVVVGAEDASATLAVVGEGNRQASAAVAPAPVIGESELWRRLGLLDDAGAVCGLYSLAMLAELVGAPPHALRRWARRGYLRPAQRVGRLEYYAYSEAVVARTLAAWLAAGHSLGSIDVVVDELTASAPPEVRPLLDWTLKLDAQRVVVESPQGPVDPHGQRRLRFAEDAPSEPGRRAGGEGRAVIARIVGDAPGEGVDGEVPRGWSLPRPADARELAHELEEEGDLAGAIEACRGALLTGPGRAEDHLYLADLLLRVGEPAAARERCYVALALDDTLVEARAALGRVLLELGDAELAAAALTAAVEARPEMADARFLLAEALDRLHRADEADAQWRSFLAVAPEGPWRDAALDRLDG